jgi:hypothetical protein
VSIRPVLPSLPIQIQTPAKTRNAIAGGHREGCAIIHSSLETIMVLSSQSSGLSCISRPLPYHLCMLLVYEHSVMAERTKVYIECCEQVPAASNKPINTIYRYEEAHSLLPTIKRRPCRDRNYFDAWEDLGSCGFA